MDRQTEIESDRAEQLFSCHIKKKMKQREYINKPKKITKPL